MSITSDWIERLLSYREERGILRFIDEQFSVTLDPWQEKALLLFESPKPSTRRISLQACVGPGKSAVLAWCAWWFLSCLGDRAEHPKGLATSITGDNLRDNLWAELAKWQGQSPYLKSQFTWTASRVFANDFPSTWFVAARSWPKTSNADELGKTFSGLHEKYVACFIDESGAIPPGVLRAGEQALSNCVFGKLLQAGNPISLDGMLYAAANQLRAQWVIVKVTGDPDDPEAWVHSPRLAAKHIGEECTCPACWAKEQIQTYGRTNPWVASYILGDFPQGATNALLSVEEVETAMRRVIKPDQYDWSQKKIGADIARFGDDRNVFYPRQGIYSFKPVVLRNMRTPALAAKLIGCALQWMGSDDEMPILYIDDTGHWGHGVIDGVLAAGYAATPVVYSDRSTDPRYENVRAFNWFTMAEWVKSGGRIDPSLQELVAELTTPTYTFSPHGRMIIEPKEFVKKRLGRSPDLADALSQTFFTPDAPKGLLARLQRSHKVRRNDDDDPTISTVTSTNVGGVGQAARDRDPW